MMRELFQDGGVLMIMRPFNDGGNVERRGKWRRGLVVSLVLKCRFSCIKIMLDIFSKRGYTINTSVEGM